MKKSFTSGFALPRERRLQAATSIPAGTDWPPALTDLEEAFLAATNAFRAQHGAGPLTFLPTLQASAEWKARDMAEFDYFAHEDIPGSVPGVPQGRSAADRVTDNGYAGPWSENLAWGSGLDPQQALARLVSAGPGEGHYDNIVNKAWTVCGMGVASDTAGSLFYSQDFGVPPPSGPRPTVTSIKPTRAQAGEAVTLTGTNLAGATSVVFSSNVRSQFQLLAGSVVATVPPGAVTGPVVVVTPGGYGVSPELTVTDASPPPPPAHERPARGDTWVSKRNPRATVHVDATFVRNGIPKVQYTNRQGSQPTTTETRFLEIFKFVRAG